jgi:purine catabolism regulator
VRKTSRLFAKLVPDGKWLVGSRDGLLYVLWPDGDAGLTMSAQQAAEAVVKEFPEMAVGVGNHYPDLGGIKTSYEEAGEAANIANCLDARAPLAFGELQLERVAHRNKLLHELARETLRPLLDYDRRKHASLVPTLEAYVNSGSNVADAGKSLFVHPNTVVYRLRRVEEICGFDPRSADGLLKLSLSLLVYKFLINENLTTEEDLLAAG